MSQTTPPELQPTVVSGAANGIGAALSLRLAARRQPLVLIDVEAEPLEEVAHTARQFGIEVSTYVGDISSEESTRVITDDLLDRFDALEGLYNIAGVTSRGRAMADSSPSDWDWVFGVNVFGAVRLIHALLPLLRRTPGAVVVNMGSIASFFGGPFNAPYSASKAAILSMSESLAAEEAARGSGIRVAVVLPEAVISTIDQAASRRPRRYGEQHGAVDEAFIEQVRGLRAAGISADLAAARILAALERGDFYIFTHPLNEAVWKRSREIAAQMQVSISS